VAEYSIEIKPSAGKELDAIDHALFARIDRKILALTENPRPPGCKKLRGYKDQWRIRVGDWRVVYTIDDDTRRVSITRVAHRREVYEYVSLRGRAHPRLRALPT
jgi:mRNA interferase RelE/StbE